MITYCASVDELIESDTCPFPLELIPNHMGINLCSVDSVSWTRQNDGQLVNVIINFNPEK